MKDGQEHYLKTELHHRLQTEPSMWTFLQLGSLDGIWYWNLEQPDDEWMSPEFWQLFGIDPATKQHSPSEWQDIIFPEDLAAATEAFHAHCADPNVKYDQIVRYLHADGSTVWVRCRGLALRDETGKPTRMLGAHNDLTAAKRSEARAIDAVKAAEAATAELRTFAYSISHDLKAPVNTLDLLLQELAQEVGDHPPGEAAYFMSMCHDTLARMRLMVESVLGYTQLAHMTPSITHQSLQRPFDLALQNLAADIDAAGAVIICEALPDIACNEDQMLVLFQNLIGNAIKFSRPETPPEVVVSVTDTDDTVEIEIKDNGIGIAPEHLDRIFTLFQRLHSSEDYVGSGLGLALCQRIAQNHGGAISVTSVEGQGASFTIALAKVH